MTFPRLDMVPDESTLAPIDRQMEQLARLLGGRAVVALTGAGCSTESGIPDYRGPGGTFRKRDPMRYGEFIGSEEARRRYWARSAVGWPRFSAARPNPAHFALARMEAAGVIEGVITQNVDGLHQNAGSRRVVELHGSLGRVVCLGCAGTAARSTVQERIRELNPAFAYAGAEPAPDGDADVSMEEVESFRVPRCDPCGGVLKPDVVFFGENVPAARVEAAWSLYGEADLLLVVGSSLSVFSGRRFVNRAREGGVPVAIVNIGPTRADEIARIKVEGQVGRVLPRVAELLSEGGPARDT